MRFKEISEGLRDPKDNPCWKGYKPVGTKQKNGRTVPNCVPKESVEEGTVNPLQDIDQNAWHLIQGDKPIAINFPDEARARSFHSGHGYGKETKVLHGSQVRRNAYLKHNPGVINWPEYSKGVAEGSETAADIDKKIKFHQQGQAAAQYKGSMNKMHAAKIRELEAKKQALKQGVEEDGAVDELNPINKFALKKIRAKHPQAKSEFDALIADLEQGQQQDRSDIGRLDNENDQEEVEIDRLDNENDKDDARLDRLEQELAAIKRLIK